MTVHSAYGLSIQILTNQKETKNKASFEKNSVFFKEVNLSDGIIGNSSFLSFRCVVLLTGNLRVFFFNV